MKIFAILLLLLTILGAEAQSTYTPLANQGLPTAVVTTSTKKYQELVAAMEQAGTKGKVKKAKSQFYLETSFMIDDLLQSGLVLFNDSINQYLHQVMEQVLKGESRELLEHVQFFVLRSPVVNAFAAPNGMVFVNLGLLARVENEAQLAFILSHELTHITHKHALNLFLDASGVSKTSRSEDLLSRSGYETSIVERKRYNRELEIEADEKAIERMLASGYDFSTMQNVINILKFADQPYENIPFFKSYLEDDYLKFPEDYFLSTVKEAEGEDEDSDDDESTHPSLSKRRNLIRTATSKAQPGKPQHLVSQQRFEEVRRKAQFELPQLFLHRHLYQEAFYHAYLLLLKEPENAYAQRIMAQSLFLMASFLNNNDEEAEAEHYSADDTEGEIQQVYQLFHTLRAEELSVLAVANLWKYHLAHPEDKQVVNMTRELLIQLKKEHELGEGAFFATLPPATEPAPAPTTPIETEKEKSKETPQKKKKSSNASTFHLYALGAWMKDPQLLTLFQEADTLSAARKEEEQHWASASGRKEAEETAKRHKKKGARLGISKLVVLNPYYLRVDKRQEKTEVEFVASEKGEMKFLSLINANASMTKAEITTIDPLLMAETDGETFNDMVLLNEWVSEQLSYGSMPIPGQKQEQVDAIAEKYGTDFFLWTGVVSIRERNSGIAYLLGCFGSLVCWPLSPIILFQTFKPKFSTVYYAVLFNIRTGAYQQIKRVELPRNDSETFLNFHLYDAFNQITHP